MTPAILVAVYYFGAVGVPVAVFWILRKTSHLSEGTAGSARRGQLRESLGDRKGMLLAAGIVVFIIMEVFWRMLFEFLIAYFQIHNALMGLQ
jgi:hypothetical protein